MERNFINTLAAHGHDLFSSDGAQATSRAELRSGLKLNKDTWKALSVQELEDLVTNLITNGAQQRRLANLRLISWNAGPHGYRDCRDEIWSIFAQGHPLICFQDLRIPWKLILAIKDKPCTQFPH